MKRLITAAVAAVMLLACTVSAHGSADPWGEYSMVNDGYGYLTANFPAEYPADKVVGEGDQVVADKCTAILLTMTRPEKEAMVSAFASDTVSWNGCARIGIPAILEGEPVDMPAVLTVYDNALTRELLAEYADDARTAGAQALRMGGMGDVAEQLLADNGREAFDAVMKKSGIVALPETIAGLDPTAIPAMTDEMLDACAWTVLDSLGTAGYLQFMQVSRDGLAAIDETPPPAITVAVLSQEMQSSDDPSGEPSDEPSGEASNEPATAFSYELISVGPGDGAEPSFDVTISVTNTGAAAAADPVQIYMPAAEAGRQLVSYGRTEDIQPGKSAQITLNIPQSLLASAASSETAVTVYAAHSAAEKTLPIELDLAAAEKPDFVIALPDIAKAGQSFEIVVTAPADVISVMLRDEAGENLDILDMLKENLGDSQRFTFTLQYDAPCAMPIYLYTMSTTGWAEEPVLASSLTVS